MKIVFVSRWFSDNMGYIENCLPKALAAMGHEVHIITTTAQVYATQDFYERSYKKFLGDPFLAPGTYQVHGVKVHRLPFRTYKSQLLIKGLLKNIKQIKPDVVQVFEHGGFDSLRIAFHSLFHQYKLFSGNHTVYSVFPQATNWANKSILAKLKVRFAYTFPGMLMSVAVKKCFCVTTDAGEIAQKFFSVPSNKVAVVTLGTDTEIFHPPNTEVEKREAETLRQQLGFTSEDVVCFYSGRLTDQKNPLITARAIEALMNRGYKNFKYLVIGEGEQLQLLEQFPFVKRIDLQPYFKLPSYYRIADIAVWPVEESTSQLDAVASGCNLLLTDKIQAYALTESDEEKPKIVSRFFKHGNEESLIQVLEELMNKNEREKTAARSLYNINTFNAWDVKAAERLKYYSE